MSKPGSVPCPICGKGLPDANAVWQHAKFHHAIILSKPNRRCLMRTAIVVALLALSPAAYAGNYDPPTRINANPSARASSASVAASQASSASSARAIGRVTQSVNVAPSSGSGVDPATLAALGNSHGGNGQFPAASAYAPSFYGANPCTGPAASLGAQFQLFGLSVGGQSMDRVCQLLELHQPTAALEYLCDQDSGVRNALARTGTPCIADRQTPVTPVADNSTPVQRPAWCKRAKPTTEASRTYFMEQCGQ
jgi:hypothetical protein